MSPANLSAASRAKDTTVNKRGYAKDQSLMADLVNRGERILGANVPDSGTAGRMLMNAMVAGGAVGSGFPAALLPAMAGALPYMPGLQRGVSSALMRRPGFAEPLANAVRGSVPLALPGFAPTAQGLLGLAP